MGNYEGKRWWWGKDSNLRRRKPADLQTAHSPLLLSIVAPAPSARRSIPTLLSPHACNAADSIGYFIGYPVRPSDGWRRRAQNGQPVTAVSAAGLPDVRQCGEG